MPSLTGAFCICQGAGNIGRLAQDLAGMTFWKVGEWSLECAQGTGSGPAGRQLCRARVSLQSGKTVIDALQGQGFDVRAVDTADSDWIARLRESPSPLSRCMVRGGTAACKAALRHCGFPIPAPVCWVLPWPWTNCAASNLWQGIGLSTGGFVNLSPATDWQRVIDRRGKVFVKPTCEGSSIGMTSAASATALARGYDRASQYARWSAGGQFIGGPEYPWPSSGMKCCPPSGLKPTEFYDYEAKYISNDTRYHCPSGLECIGKRRKWASWRCGRSAHSAARSGVGLTSCGIWPAGFYVLEVNTIPG